MAGQARTIGEKSAWLRWTAFEARMNLRVTIYGQCTRKPSDLFTLNSTWLHLRPTNWTSTVSAPNIDDVRELWVGGVAYSGRTRQNANLDQAIFQTSASYTVTLTAGQYYPVRIVFGQAEGPAAFQSTVTRLYSWVQTRAHRSTWCLILVMGLRLLHFQLSVLRQNY